jgi:iron complex outermembrane recepter protein
MLKTMPKVVIVGQMDAAATNTMSVATKMKVPLRDVPASVQVVPREVLEDRGVTQIGQIADTVSGVHQEASYGANGGTFFNIRGFSSANTLRDGFRAEGNLATRDVQNIETVEVLKGPTGALYAPMGALGGYINTVSKRPHEGTFGEVGITGGSFGLVRPFLDYNAPLDSKGSLLGRVNLAYEHNDTFRSFGGYWSVSAAPSLRWNISPDSSVILLTEYNHLHQDTFDFGVLNDPRTLVLSRRTYYGLPGYDFGRNDNYSATLLFEHDFNADWKWRESANFNYARQLSGQTFAYGFSGPDNFAVAPYTPEFSSDYTLQSDLEGKFETGSVRHTVLGGIDLASYTRGGDPFTQGFATVDPLNLNYSVQIDPASVSLYDVYDNRVDDLALYLQDLVEITEQWKAFAGLRADWNQSTLTPHMAGDRSFSDHYFNFSPRAGLVYQPQKSTSLYASWGRSAVTVAQSIYSSPGVPPANVGFEPEQSRQFEMGVKQEFLGGKLDATLATYRLERSHVLTADPSNPLMQIQTGKQQSEGVEFDMAGQIASGWRVIGTYSYCDAKVTRDNLFPVGDRLANVPHHSGSLWSTYRFQEGALKGGGFGLGEVYVGSREAQLPNTFTLSGYWRTDAVVFYERSKWKAQLNVFNIFDRTYYFGGFVGSYNSYVRPGQPFSLQATVSCKF